MKRIRGCRGGRAIDGTKRKLAKGESAVNNILRTDLRVLEFPAQHQGVPEFDMRDLFGRFVLELVQTSGMSAKKFGERVGIAAPTFTTMKPGAEGYRGGSWTHIEKIVAAGVATPPEVFERLFALAQAQAHPSMQIPEPRLTREKLRARLLSGEIHQRAASAVPEPPTTERPLPPKPSGRLQDRKTGGKG